MKTSSFSRFAGLSLLCIGALAFGMGLALSALLTQAVWDWEWENTTAYVQQAVEQSGLDDLLSVHQDPEVWERWAQDTLPALTTLPEVVRIKLWDREATVLWSDQTELIGRQFPGKQNLQVALGGHVAVAIETTAEGDHATERALAETLAEVYVPVVSKKSGRVVGVLEIYKIPRRLLATIRWGRIVIWAISLSGGLALYLVLTPLVRQYYRREIYEEALRIHARRLEEEVLRRTRQLERVLDQSTARQSRLEALLEISRQLCLIQPVESLLGSITEACGRLLDSESTGIRLLQGDDLAVMSQWGSGEATMATPRLKIGESLSGLVALTGEPLVVRDPVDDRRLSPAHRDAYRQLGVRGFLGVPVKIRDRVAGVLGLRTKRESGFSAEDVAIAQAFASQAAVALENARLYEEAEARRRRLATLVDVAQRLTGRLDPDDVLGSIAGAAAAIFQGEAGFRLLDGEELVRVGATPGAQRAMQRERLRVGESLSGRVAETGEPLIAPDTAADPRLIPEHRASSQREGCGALMCVPVRLEGRVLGTLHIFRERGYRFDEEALEVATALASQAATALENARLYQEIRHTCHELSRAQSQFLQAQKMEAVGRLAGGVAHDFNNLMTVILGRSELLLRRLALDDPMRRSVQLMATTAERAAALTHQLLAFSRKQVLQPRVVDLNAIVAGMQKILRRLIGEDIELVTSIGPAVGCVEADPGQLEQVIMNLAVNARDAMPRGGRLALAISNAEMDEAFVSRNRGAIPGSYVMLAVSDDGVGMDVETQAHIFEPFFTTKEPGKGTGLGLATVYGIVKQHEGYIAVESEPGLGTTFQIYLPRVEAVEAVEPGCGRAGSPRGTETVLLVEDEEPVRDLAREMLREQGYSVLEARDGVEALEISARCAAPIELLVTDVVMPRMSGRALADRLAAERPEMRVLYMSGYTDDAIIHHGVVSPGTAFLHKPFTSDTIARAVRAALDGFREAGSRESTACGVAT